MNLSQRSPKMAEVNEKSIGAMQTTDWKQFLWLTKKTSSTDFDEKLYFTIWFAITQVLYVAIVLMTLCWLLIYCGGFGWVEAPDLILNYHPLFMILGPVFLNGEAILMYRIFYDTSKSKVKLLHASTHVMVLVFIILGLTAVIYHKDLSDPPEAHVYSVHSSIGVLTVTLIGLQWLLGFLMYLYPGFDKSVKDIYKPLHIFFGLTIYVLCLTSALTGLVNFTSDYEPYTSELYLVMFIGLLIITVGIITHYVLTGPGFQRKDFVEGEETSLLHGGSRTPSTSTMYTK